MAISSDFANGMYNSCKDVQFPSNNQKVNVVLLLIAIVCLLPSVTIPRNAVPKLLQGFVM